MAPIIRPFHPSDLPGVYRLCLLTGEAGGDASGLYRDPDLLGHLYAGPYPVADPSLTFVVADDDGVVGYVVATADSLGFARWLDEHWWPVLRAQHPRVGDPGDGTQDHVLVERIHTWPTAPEPQYDEFPAHLHIDLHPRLQGQGWGRRLIGTLAEALRARGVTGVHLGVDDRNTGAQAFYARLGFETFAVHDWGRTLSLRL
ncbi:GNAT family N-acetyltransferase [Cellulomonas sp. DKR-3]|uniref:GNAT family N-acetyltransferase n=1 Tax=Cellulomonas fulva TaxID=2835530 RepID=A0ABS5TX19_9CELL|nr:GNAT family N-acetyltransferase [Cellulomonas fulva]MBT0993654.1 GNAT family N-acetyltransferase [Cellulomonas fulva]